ncbi:PREDICTED: serine/arginine repetitive matrix protein 1-like [Chinchilla lanigera]|uniref:serine/arginine repetitive matrix protein 1-like n=1 Tax=Chinchilla lanigera TaxID=34839 RepID=UPI0006981A69|nr:PREDICTED: serine/arginine repetitive matrix protein 1-like [Chinchilla lanigera]
MQLRLHISYMCSDIRPVGEMDESSAWLCSCGPWRTADPSRGRAAVTRPPSPARSCRHSGRSRNPPIAATTPPSRNSRGPGPRLWCRSQDPGAGELSAAAVLTRAEHPAGARDGPRRPRCGAGAERGEETARRPLSACAGRARGGDRAGRGRCPRAGSEGSRRPAPPPRPGGAGAAESCRERGRPEGAASGSSAERGLWLGSLQRTRSSEEVAAQSRERARVLRTCWRLQLLRGRTRRPGPRFWRASPSPSSLTPPPRRSLLPGLAHVHADGAEPLCCPPRIPAELQGTEPRGLLQGQTRSQGDPSFLRKEAGAGSGTGEGAAEVTVKTRGTHGEFPLQTVLP